MEVPKGKVETKGIMEDDEFTAEQPLPPHPSHLGHPWCWGPQPHPQSATGVKVQRSAKPGPPGALGVEETGQGK